MPRANLAISLRNAMSPNTIMPSDSAVSEPSQGLPTPRLRRRPGRWLAALADYVRRYLNANADHQLQVVHERLEALQDRLALLDQRLVDLIVRQEQQTAILDRQSMRLEKHVDDIKGHVDGVPGVLGPRLDELDIKTRPLIAFDEESYAVRLRDGYAMAPRSEPLFCVMIANAQSGGLEPGTRHVLKALVQPGMGVADIGANIGLLTLSCAVATGPTGQVYAFEPEAGPRAQLMKTLELNGLNWVHAYDLAVGAQTKQTTFNISPIIGHSSLHPLPAAEQAAARTVQVQVTRLDDVIAPGARLDVVKIDVEGAELEVLNGMPRLLADNPDMALVVEFGPSHLERLNVTPEAWMAAFLQAGLTPYLIEEPTGRCRPITLTEIKDVDSVNLAFVRPGGGAQSRLPS